MIESMEQAFKNKPEGATEGEAAYVEMQGRVRDLGGALMISSDRLEEMSRESKTDEMTGLLNRKGLDEILTEILSYEQEENRKPYAVFIDLNGFKNVNDKLKHAVGDQLLKDVGNILRQHTWKGDVKARLGGDEFVLVLSHIEKEEDARKVCERLQTELHALRQELRQKGGEDFIFSASFGITALQKGDSIQTFIQRADTHMYHAKKADTKKDGMIYADSDAKDEIKHDRAGIE